MTVEVDGENLTIDDVVQVARHYVQTRLSETALPQVTTSREVVEKAVREKRVIYGVNTGFGDLAQVSIASDDIAQLQVNLIRSHSVGVGPSFSEEIVRGMMLLRANTLAKGCSGVRIEIIETLLNMLNERVTPVVPQQGSVGASGDLAPLAHMVLVMIGEGEAFYQEKRTDGKTAMNKAGIRPIMLQAKEGVALINGTQPMTAAGLFAVHDSMQLMRNSTIAAAMSLEAHRGTRVAFDERIHASRPHEGQMDVAKAMREILRDSEINQSHANCGKVQDAYSLRCIPQVLGASLVLQSHYLHHYNTA